MSCRALQWRIDFIPPRTVREPDRRLEDATTWRVSQWKWVEDETVEAGDVDDAEDGADWRLRAHAPITTDDVIRHLPAALTAWARRATQDAVELFGHIAAEEPEFGAAAARLKQELEALP